MPIRPAKQSIESCHPTASFKIKPITPPTHCGLSHPSVENSGDFWKRVEGERCLRKKCNSPIQDCIVGHYSLLHPASLSQKCPLFVKWKNMRSIGDK
jgi:hypothetical protein